MQSLIHQIVVGLKQSQLVLLSSLAQGLFGELLLEDDASDPSLDLQLSNSWHPHGDLLSLPDLI